MDGMEQPGEADRAVGKGATVYIAIGWITAVVSLIRFPFLFGVVSVIMGIISYRQGSRAALPLIASSIVLMAIGLIFNGVFYDNIRQALSI